MRKLAWSNLVYTCLIVTALALLSAPGAQAAPVFATTYDMINGTTGSFDYRDFIYSPDPNGNANNSSLPLTGGLGKLTNGDIPAGHWDSYGQPTPYVGWDGSTPAITFHFAGPVNINQVGIYVDNTPGYGDVRYPASVAIQMGAVTDNISVSSDPNYSTGWFYFPTTGLSGNALTLTLYPDQGTWIMLGEVSFDGTPVPLPPGLLLVGSGLVGLVGWRRFRKS